MSARTLTEVKSDHDRTRRIADTVRVSSLISVGACAIWWGIPETIGFTVVLLGLLVPRIARLAGPFDTAFCITIFAATWSGIAGLYEAIAWWDLLVHFVSAGASAAVLYLLLARTGITPESSSVEVLPTRSVVVLTFALGMTAAVGWEFIEWAGNAYISKGIHVGYEDTLADLAVGGAGALLSGLALARWKAR